MTLEEFRREMIAYRRSVDEEARALKDSYLALERMAKLYRKFDDDERRMADRVLGEWVMSEDRDLRFDALWIIDEMNIVAALPALQDSP